MITAIDSERGDEEVLRDLSVTAIAISPEFVHDRTVFAATLNGLFRSRDAGKRWSLIGDSDPARAVTAVAVSPGYAEDGEVLAASLDGAVLRLTRNGASWISGGFHAQPVEPSALVMSPAFSTDGIAFTATLSDGVFVTRNRGVSWEASRFGLLDLEVMALGISPQFSSDETLFAATVSGVFRSPKRWSCLARGGPSRLKEPPCRVWQYRLRSLLTALCMQVQTRRASFAQLIGELHGSLRGPRCATPA